jgi:hypothetical protein
MHPCVQTVFYSAAEALTGLTVVYQNGKSASIGSVGSPLKASINFQPGTYITSL